MVFGFFSLSCADWFSVGATFSALNANYSLSNGDTTSISNEGAISARAFVSRVLGSVTLNATLGTSLGSSDVKANSALELSFKRSGFSASTRIFVDGCHPWDKMSVRKYWGQSISASVSQQIGEKAISLRLLEVGRSYPNSKGTYSSFQRVTSGLGYSFPLGEALKGDLGFQLIQHTVPDTESASYSNSAINIGVNKMFYFGWSEICLSLARQDGAHPDGINSYWQAEFSGKHGVELSSVISIVPNVQILSRKHDNEKNPYYDYIWSEVGMPFSAEKGIFTFEVGPLLRKQWASISFPTEEFFEPALKCELTAITLSGNYASLSSEVGFRSLKADTVNFFGNYYFASIGATILWQVFEKTHIEIVGFWSPEWHKKPGEDFTATYIWCGLRREF